MAPSARVLVHVAADGHTGAVEELPRRAWAHHRLKVFLYTYTPSLTSSTPHYPPPSLFLTPHEPPASTTHPYPPTLTHPPVPTLLP